MKTILLACLCLIPVGLQAQTSSQIIPIVKEVFRTVGRELLATLCLIGTLVVVTVISGVMLTLAVEPAIEAFLRQRPETRADANETWQVLGEALRGR